MTNSIDSLVDGPIPRLNDRRTDTAQHNPGAGKTLSDAEASSDLLDLTGKALTLKALEQDLAKTAEFDTAKVAELRETISAGAYKVDSVSIAEKLLDLESKLP